MAADRGLSYGGARRPRPASTGIAPKALPHALGWKRARPICCRSSTFMWSSPCRSKLPPSHPEQGGRLWSFSVRSHSRNAQENCRRPKHLGAEIGFTAVLHIWGQTLTHHPHMPDGASWIACRPGYYPSASFTPDCKQPFSGPEPVLRYLSRYTHCVAISNHHLVAVTDAGVAFTWKGDEELRGGGVRLSRVGGGLLTECANSSPQPINKFASLAAKCSVIHPALLLAGVARRFRVGLQEGQHGSRRLRTLPHCHGSRSTT